MSAVTQVHHVLRKPSDRRTSTKVSSRSVLCAGTSFTTRRPTLAARPQPSRVVRSERRATTTASVSKDSSGEHSSEGGACPDPALLPGDPSLTINTNVSMGERKLDFMKRASKLLAASLSKPESYVAVCVQDNLDLIWNGEAEPCALCTVHSLGAINKENNTVVSAGLCEMFSEFGIPANRYYISFFDVPRANMGYNGATF